MTLYPAYPPGLAAAEMAMVRFDLDLLTPCVLELENLLGLRRLLLQAAGVLPTLRRTALFEPPLSHDSAALRRFQKPAPPFVIRSVETLRGDHQEGDRLQLEVLFLGTGTLTIADFIVVLQNLGVYGLVSGQGRFELGKAQSQGGDGKWRPFWRDRRETAEPVPELVRLDQWLDRNWPEALPLLLELTTPARLVAGGRVLRRPRFDQLFPFLLRRVSSMLHAHCAIEPVDEPSVLLEAAAHLEAEWLGSRWIDWRELGSEGITDSVGGLVGRLRLNEPGLGELLWIVLLATLFGIGKGAAYGAGGCRLFPAELTC